MAAPLDPSDAPLRAADRKHRAILDAAATVFLRDGYAGASMDEITALAGASKATVYRHFTDKQSLFAELVAATVEAVSDPVEAEITHLGDSGDLEVELRGLARRLLGAVMQPRVLQLRRLIIGEASRFPALGRVFYEAGPGRTITTLADVLRRLGGERQLQLDDPHHAAEQLNWLILATPLNRAMLLGDDEPLTPAQLADQADAAVRVFLAAYRR
jgi:AcrR family transcriptional regulator